MDVWTANNQRAGEIGAVKAGYPVTSVCGKTGDVALDAGDVGALATGGTAADSSKLGGKAPEYYLQPRNLLDNSDFRNPVNQRGQTTYNAEGYTIDQYSIWSVNGDASLTLVEGGIVFNPGSGGGTFTQKLPLGLLDSAKTYTLAVHKSSGETEVRTGCVTFNHNGNGDLVTISDVQETIVWAALYEGSYTADTLPPYVPKGYAAELAACNSAPVDVGGGYGGGSLQAYPVGSIYVSATPTSPASLFGGTWEQLKDRFLLGAGGGYAAGGTGGAETVALEANQLPKITGYIEAGAGSSGSATSSGHGAFRSASGIFTTSRQCHYSYGHGSDTWTSTDTDAWQQVNMSFGNNEAHNNMPPYLAVYMWKRVS